MNITIREITASIVSFLLGALIGGIFFYQLSKLITINSMYKVQLDKYEQMLKIDVGIANTYKENKPSEKVKN